MTQKEKLSIYCKRMLLDFEIEENILHLDDKAYLILELDTQLFDEELNFLPAELDFEEEFDGWVYEVAGRWYTQDGDIDETKMEELKYIGKAVQKIPTKSFLGIHSGYELMNGMGLYKEWIQKAKFLGVKTLGICEKNTLSGVIDFQNQCLSNEIKPIIGITVPIAWKDGSYDVKVYAKNFQGWLNLLKFSSIINVDKRQAIAPDFFSANLNGVFSVVDPQEVSPDEVAEGIDFYQLSTTVFINEDVDAEFLDNYEKFLKSHLEPISIVDAFYLEKEDFEIREQLWQINKVFYDKTNNLYFKNQDQYAAEFIEMFDEEDKSWIKLYKKARRNEAKMIEQCSFLYDTDTRHLPKYMMNEKESLNFDTNEELFMFLIKQGFKKRKLKNPNKYIDRLKAEIKVLKMGDVIDYFLVLHDIIQYSKKEGMLTGIGRGSAGGSLVAYLLDIIQIDPLEFDLLFERFLNSGRIGEWVDRPSFTIISEGKEISLVEGSLVKIIRKKIEMNIFVHELEVGDDLIKW